VTDAEKTSQAFTTGTDYVLSVQRVGARLVASEAHGERVVDMASRVRVVRSDGAPFAGESTEAHRRDTDRGWTVVGVSRGGTVRTNAETVIEADDNTFVAGSDETIRRFEAETRS